MRDMVTCFSDHAVRVSETTFSSSSSHYTQPYTLTTPNHPTSPLSIQNAVVSLYRTPHLFITVTWTRNHSGQITLSMSFNPNPNPNSNSNPNPSTSFNIYNSLSRLFRKNKGQKTIEINSLKIDVFWDLSNVDFQSGLEPVNGYYILVTIDSTLGLALGDLSQEAILKKLRLGHYSMSEPSLKPNSSLISRKEYLSGNAVYTTKAKFSDSGGTHEIMIRCCEDQEKLKQPALYVSVDKRTVIKIRRLQWNFRGNQTVFVDGLLVDMMWDVHDWFFNPGFGSGLGSGQGVFMFKTRSGSDSRLWLEDTLSHKDQDRLDFSLVIYASKNN